MKYSKFEQIVLPLIIVIILVMAVTMMFQESDWVEVVGHSMMIVVIFASLNWGFRGGLPAFAVCIAAYTGLRLGFKAEDMTTQVAWELIAAKFVTYGVLTLLCSYMRNSLRYFFIKMEHQDYIDDETQIGNMRFLLKELTSRIDENERYEVPFSLVTFTLDREFLDRIKGTRGVSILRDLSTSILKNDTRSVDELARMDNQLVVILPCVRRDGANVCCKRLENKMRRYLDSHSTNGEAELALDARVLEFPEDREDIESMVTILRGTMGPEEKKGVGREGRSRESRRD